MSKTFDPQVAQKLREAREKANVSQSVLAAQLNISQQAYSRYEVDKEAAGVGIPIRRLLRLCELLPLDRDEILDLYHTKNVEEIQRV